MFDQDDLNEFYRQDVVFAIRCLRYIGYVVTGVTFLLIIFLWV
jgi:hypothetical protein